MTPDDTAKAGDPRQHSGSSTSYKVPSSYWNLRGSARRDALLEDFVEELVGRIEPASAALIQLPPDSVKKILLQV